MNAPYTAQCPSCNTAIDLSQADMERANGDITCNHCQKHFHAPDHLLKGFFVPSLPQPSTPSTAPKPMAENKITSMDTDDIMLPSATKYSEYRRKKLLRRSGLILVNGCLVIFLLFQLLWINFDKWAARENLRPIYGFLCSIENLSCQLPAWMEPDGLVLENFQVDLRDDSTYVIQAILTNKDNREQVFPWVDVVFSDINGIVIASGRFSPYQYLLPQVTDSLMTGGSSYDILLEVRKPSYPVVSYEMRLVAVPP